MNNCDLRKLDLGATALHPIQFYGACVLCEKETDRKCDRCGDFYCSEICQRKDWPSHRYICFPMPKLVKAGRNENGVQPEIAANVSATSTKSNSPKNDHNKSKEDKVKNVVEPEIVASVSATSTKSSMPPNGSCVILTGFKSTNRCFILSTNPSIVAEYQKTLNEINEFGKKSSVYTENPKDNPDALALREDKWCRVEISGFSKDHRYRVTYVDYGDSCKRNLKNLRKIEPSLVNLPCLIHLVQLNNVTKISFEAKCLESLVKYTNKEYKIEFVDKDRFGGNVKLSQWDNNVLLNSLIMTSVSKKNFDKDTEDVSTVSSLTNSNTVTNKDGLQNTQTNGTPNKNESASITSTAESNVAKSNNIQKSKRGFTPRQIQLHKPCLEPPFEMIPLNENDRNCYILIVDDSYIESGYIGCVLEKHFDNLKEILKFLSEYNIPDQPYKPKFNEHCLAMYEETWNRAKVVEILSDDKFLVVYTDFTNEMELTSKSIRHYPMSLTLPCYTTLCGIEGLPEDISEEQVTFLKENCQSFTSFKIEKVRIMDNIPYVESQELLNKMRNAKLL